MVSTYTPNLNLEEPARGDDVGTWDTPVNNNMSLIDKVAGAIASITLNNSPIVLTSAQFQARQISFGSTLTGSCAITFPSTFTKSYQVENVCTGTSAFVVTLQTTVSGGQVIACPPGECVTVYNDGTNIRFVDLGRIGSYMDIAGSSMPNWIDACSPVKPYLNADGSTFSSSTYPALAARLGGTTLPDQRGRTRAALNQTTTRMLSSNGGVDGNTLLAAGGADTQTLTLAQIPTGITSSGAVTDISGFNIAGADGNISGLLTATSGVPVSAQTSAGTFHNATLKATVTSANTGGGAHPIMQPTLVGGLSLIRAG